MTAVCPSEGNTLGLPRAQWGNPRRCRGVDTKGVGYLLMKRMRLLRAYLAFNNHTKRSHYVNLRASALGSPVPLGTLCKEESAVHQPHDGPKRDVPAVRVGSPASHGEHPALHTSPCNATLTSATRLRGMARGRHATTRDTRWPPDHGGRETRLGK